MTKNEIQAQINNLQKQLDKRPEVEPFTCKGKWLTYIDGKTDTLKERNIEIIEAFDFWQTEEIAKKAYQLQLRHRKMLSFVSQHQELDVGNYFVYKSIADNSWEAITTGSNYNPDVVVMTRKTANLMLEAIENGSLNLEETT